VGSENRGEEVNYFQQAASWRCSSRFDHFRIGRACSASMIYTRLVIVVVVYRCNVIDEMVSIKSTLDLARVHFTWLGAHRPRGWQIFVIT
jgi:hypothetical protein